MAQKNELPAREEMNPEYCWKLEDLFSDDEKWEESCRELEQKITALGDLKGRMAEGPMEMYQVLEYCMQLEQRLERIYVYANQKYHQDTGNQKYQEMSGKAEKLSVSLSDAASFLEPEILAMDRARLENWLKDSEPLRLYERYLKEKIRLKPHILSEEMEGVLAKAGELGQRPPADFYGF